MFSKQQKQQEVGVFVTNIDNIDSRHIPREPLENIVLLCIAHCLHSQSITTVILVGSNS